MRGSGGQRWSAKELRVLLDVEWGTVPVGRVIRDIGKVIGLGLPGEHR